MPFALFSLPLMKRFFSIAVLLVGLLSTSACGGGEAPSLQAGAFSFTSTTAQVASEIDGFIFVQARINGVSGNFILDTGAQAFVVDPAFAAEAGLEVVGEGGLETLAGVSTVPIRRISLFQFGNIEAVGLDALEIDLGGFDGIIGEPFFRSAVVTIDYGSGVINIDQPNDAPLEFADALRVGLDGLRFEGIAIDGVPAGPLLLDTGSSGGIFISTQIRIDIPEENSFPTTVSVLNGNLPATGFIAEEVTLDGSPLEPQFVVVQDSNFGLVGNQLLGQFTVVLDVGRNQAFFLSPATSDLQVLARLSLP